MHIVSTYNTISEATESEFKDRGSKFYGFAHPVLSIEECKELIKEIKSKHPKAIHFCFAYRLGTNNLIYRSSDDGEPSGSAGKPILGQIDSLSLTNVLIVVVRYWGGTLLGVPGLINAYKTSASMCLEVAEIIERDIHVTYKLQYNYTMLGIIMQILKQADGRLINNEQQLFCVSEIAIALKNEKLFLTLISDMHNIVIEKMNTK